MKLSRRSVVKTLESDKQARTRRAQPSNTVDGDNHEVRGRVHPKDTTSKKAHPITSLPHSLTHQFREQSQDRQDGQKATRHCDFSCSFAIICGASCLVLAEQAVGLGLPTFVGVYRYIDRVRLQYYTGIIVRSERLALHRRGSSTARDRNDADVACSCQHPIAHLEVCIVVRGVYNVRKTTHKRMGGWLRAVTVVSMI
jgi:hypothetical protein